LLGTCQRRLRHLQGCKLSRAETRGEFRNAELAQFVRVSEKSFVHHYPYCIPGYRRSIGKDGDLFDRPHDWQGILNKKSPRPRASVGMAVESGPGKI
jgi:hypothetical protein